MIAVDLRKVLRHLPLTESIVQRVVDQLRLDAVARGGIAVDGQGEGGALGLLVGGDVAELWKRLEFLKNLRRPLVQFVEVGILQRVFELRARGASAEADVLRGLHKDASSFEFLELRSQSRNNLLCTHVAFIARLQRDEHASVVESVAAAADRHSDTGDRWIFLNDRSDLGLKARHFLERNVLSAFGNPGDQANVLLRKEALRDDDEKVAGQRDGGEKHAQCGEAPSQHEIETPLVAAQHGVEEFFTELVEFAVLGVSGMRLQKPGCHHRSQRQGHDQRHENSHCKDDGEFAEQTSDNATH